MPVRIPVAAMGGANAPVAVVRRFPMAPAAAEQMGRILVLPQGKSVTVKEGINRQDGSPAKEGTVVTVNGMIQHSTLSSSARILQLLPRSLPVEMALHGKMTAYVSILILGTATCQRGT